MRRIGDVMVHFARRTNHENRFIELDAPALSMIRFGNDSAMWRNESARNPWLEVRLPQRRLYRPVPIDHAAPLSPLRNRDLEILASWFERDDWSDIEVDIKIHLEQLFPEPPWEENLLNPL